MLLLIIGVNPILKQLRLREFSLIHPVQRLEQFFLPLAESAYFPIVAWHNHLTAQLDVALHGVTLLHHAFGELDD